MRIVPVRHHSPGNAWHLAEEIRAVRPRCVLIEGPGDATPLVSHLLASDTQPPVAILAFFPATESAPPLSALWPFSSYSPEWVALTVGAEVGAELRFIDAPAALALVRRAEMRQPKNEAQAHPETPPEQPLPQMLTAFARRFGFDSYAEFWESRFEMLPGPDLNPALLEFGQLVREQPSPDPGWTAYNDQRESWMRAQIRRALDDGFAPHEIMVVCGAAHAPILDVTQHPPGTIPSEEEHVDTLAALEAARLTLIPYSYLRLSEQVGYGAGNHAPAYYQTVWERGLDFEAATQEYLIRVAGAMHDAGFVVSTADAIEANRLARALAGLRDKPAPGFFELREAAEACFGRAQVEIGAFLTPITIGDAIGSVSQGVERTTVQEEFYATVAGLGLPLTDSSVQHTLHLTQPQGVDASIFLHRLNAVGVPYAHLRGSRSTRTSSGAAPLGSLLRRIQQRDSPHAPEPAQLLGQLREEWTLQWSPATDISLIEKSILGNTLGDICRRFYRERLDEVKNVSQASELLLKIVLAGLAGLYDEALAVCERISAHDDDLVAQAQAAQKLQLLLAYGSTRAMDQAPIAPLLNKVFTRAVFLLPGAAAVRDEAVQPVLGSIKVLYEVAGRLPDADQDVLAGRLERTLKDGETHPAVRGLCVALLFISGRMPEEEMLRSLNYQLASNAQPQEGAQFLEGFLTLNRNVILRNPTVVTWLNTFVEALSLDSFVHTLPVLRRAFSTLSRPELEHLVSVLLDVLGLGAEEALAIGSALSEEELAALNEEIGKRLAGASGEDGR